MLVLEPPTREEASRYLRGEPSAAPVFQRWSRAAALGANADSDAYPVGTTDADLATRRDRLTEVFRERRALLAPLGKHLAGHSLVAVIADPEGVIVGSHGGSDPAMRVRLIEGARWSEDTRGTNAIGTAIAERRAVAVIGAAHYEKRNHGIFCYGHPILDAYGDLTAVLDVTGPMSEHDPAVASSVRAAAISLQQALRRLAYAQSGAGTLSAIERLIHRSSSASLLVEANGQVDVLNGHARGMLGTGALTCEKIFGIAFDDLQRAVIEGTGDMRFQTETGEYRVELDPINGASARTFAVVVHFEAVRARARRPATRDVLPPAFGPILGTDPMLVAAKTAANRFAATPLPVLLLAETGTGKELMARAIHNASPRANGAFVALNCGALAASVLESELFGHGPNAFTGAAKNGSDGKIAAADGGTLFLDEIAEMPDALQAALLRVLDEGAYYRVGDARPRRSDFRLICATCRELPALVEKGAFRRDLFFRIHGACVTLPPLRDREDKLQLAEGLLAPLGGVLGATAKKWIVVEHDWPGNVRELKSALIHAHALAGTDPIEREHFPHPLVHFDSPRSEEPRTRVAIINDAIVEAVKASAGNVSEAARRLGIARSTVYRVLRGKS